jgi:plasmid stabilization system protein ParE
LKVRILDLAEADLLHGSRFYERQGPGLGQYFLDSLYSDIESLRLFGGVHRRVFGFHRLLSNRFPYAVYYRISATEIDVWRVLDCRRDPHWIRNELKTLKARMSD